jgi:hypothetical protein
VDRGGQISSHVDRTFPLAQTAEALKVLAGRKAMGKVILASVMTRDVDRFSFNVASALNIVVRRKCQRVCAGRGPVCATRVPVDCAPGSAENACI